VRSGAGGGGGGREDGGGDGYWSRMVNSDPTFERLWPTGFGLGRGREPPGRSSERAFFSDFGVFNLSSPTLPELGDTTL